jgi:hypothetical protein
MATVAKVEPAVTVSDALDDDDRGPRSQTYLV